MNAMGKITIVVIAAIMIAVLVIAVYVHSQSFAQGAVANSAKLLPGGSAPIIPFYFANGTTGSIKEFRGRTLLLYLVTTWCSTCAEGTSAISSNIGFFIRKNVTILEVETYNDFNYSGMPITQFVSEFAGSNSSKIIAAISTYNFTAAYDPKGYLDIYYLVSPSGKIEYINSEPSITMPQLMHAINSSVVK